ncbi:uncharacterized protein LOC116339048 [Contarinia nasturtii]|uniref:uncharacterized protein LOC116339048 n=1 Tax=Contarinia nasturtii TaxID=265458 RepID=UPI0012D3BBDE|nr:uncharacterized protein LOC116339048 [Contarinia nasturtii]
MDKQRTYQSNCKKKQNCKKKTILLITLKYLKIKMWHHFASTERLSTNRSDTQSPYAKNYRTNLTHDQREQLSHRQNISRIPRREFEDRYIALLDEYYALKKENAANNQKIKRMATKLLRLSAESKSRGATFPQQLAPNENLEIQIYRLEAYNSLLKDRLNSIIKKYANCATASISTIRRPASCSNFSMKRKIILSEDDLHLLEIPELPTLITSDVKLSTIKTASNKSQDHYNNSQSSIIFENDIASIHQESGPSELIEEERGSNNNLKNTIHKLEMELNEAKTINDSLQQLNTSLEEKLTHQLMEKCTELVELRRTMIECEMELHELRDQYINLKTKAEYDLDEEHRKIDELTQIVQNEMDRNTTLSKDLQSLRNGTGCMENINIIKNDDKGEVQRLNESINKNGVEDINIVDVSNKKEELEDLLNEAKSSIIQLQEEIRLHKFEIDKLRQINFEQEKQIDSLQSNNKSKSNLLNNELHPPSLPLEPIIIIQQHKNQSNSEVDANDKKESCAKEETNSIVTPSINNQTSQSDNTFIITKDKSQKQVKKKPKQLNMRHNVPNPQYSTTDSEMSSLDSEQHYRLFQNKNQIIQNSMMFMDLYRSHSISFSQRMSFLEKIAYYRPLAYILPRSNDIDSQSHFLACDCNGFECDHQNEMFYEEIRRAVENARSIILQEIQNNPYAENGCDNYSEANKCFNDSSECREFLRVQYNLNMCLRQELERICKICKKERQEFMKQIDSLKSKLQNYEDEHRLELEKSARMLFIDHDEGSFELHVNAFRPTKEGRLLLSCRHGELGSLYVSWNFYECKIESRTSIRPPPYYSYESSHIYVVSINKQFLTRLHNEKLVVNLIASSSTGSTTTTIGSVNINLAEVLIFPHNKIQLTTKVISISNDCNHTDTFCECDVMNATKARHVGNLTLWFRLTCELDVLKSLYNRNEYWASEQNSMMQEEQNTSITQPKFKLKKSSSKLDVTNINTENQPKDEQILIIITIVCLRFNTNYVIPNETKEQIHIEYSFLNSRRLKTDRKPLSSNQLNFNFTQKFMHSDRNQQRLANILIDAEQSIKLTVFKTKQLSETCFEDESENVDVEIGFGLLHLGKFISEWNGPDENTPDIHIFEIPILSKQPPYHNIAYLDISIEDIATLKHMQKIL